MRILITGGAGFIGSHSADGLLSAGYEVRLFDALESQVHGPERRWPGYLASSVERIRGDVRDRAALAKALAGADAVLHLAAATGVGQSMYRIRTYFETNVQGTANLLDILAQEPHKVRKLVVASSRAVYGEGRCQCPRCGPVAPAQRSPAQMTAKAWEVTCPKCASAVTPALTPESKSPQPASMYAITKLTQEQMCLCFGQAYGLPVVALRYFNVYGSRQSFCNGYTGIIAAFLSRLFSGKAPEVYEDGLMTRDMVHVSDVVHANLLALEEDRADGHVINVGTGVSTAILDLARLLCEQVRPDLSPGLVGVARIGDIRHCTADLEAARKFLGYEPGIRLSEGVADVIEYAKQQYGLQDQSEAIRQELATLGLLK